MPMPGKKESIIGEIWKAGGTLETGTPVGCMAWVGGGKRILNNGHQKKVEER